MSKEIERWCALGFFWLASLRNYRHYSRSSPVWFCLYSAVRHLSALLTEMTAHLPVDSCNNLTLTLNCSIQRVHQITPYIYFRIVLITLSRCVTTRPLGCHIEVSHSETKIWVSLQRTDMLSWLTDKNRKTELGLKQSIPLFDCQACLPLHW